MFKRLFKTERNWDGDAIYPKWNGKRLMTNEDVSEVNKRIDLLCEHLGLSPYPDTECKTKLITKKEQAKRDELSREVW